jgi:hypothetical protein
MSHPIARLGQQRTETDIDRTVAEQQLALARRLLGAGIVGHRVVIDPVGQRGGAPVEMGQQFPGLRDLLLTTHQAVSSGRLVPARQ